MVLRIVLSSATICPDCWSCRAGYHLFHYSAMAKELAPKLQLARLFERSSGHSPSKWSQLRQFLHCWLYLSILDPKESLCLVVQGTCSVTLRAKLTYSSTTTFSRPLWMSVLPWGLLCFSSALLYPARVSTGLGTTSG